MTEHKQEAAKPTVQEWAKLAATGFAISILFPTIFYMLQHIALAIAPDATSQDVLHATQSTIALVVMVGLVYAGGRYIKTLPFGKPWRIVILATIVSELTILPSLTVAKNSGASINNDASSYILNIVLLGFTHAGLMIFFGYLFNREAMPLRKSLIKKK